MFDDEDVWEGLESEVQDPEKNRRPGNSLVRAFAV